MIRQRRVEFVRFGRIRLLSLARRMGILLIQTPLSGIRAARETRPRIVAPWRHLESFDCSRSSPCALPTTCLYHFCELITLKFSSSKTSAALVVRVVRSRARQSFRHVTALSYKARERSVVRRVSKLSLPSDAGVMLRPREFLQSGASNTGDNRCLRLPGRNGPSG